MIGRLSGTLLEKHPPHLVVDAHGVGYEVDVPMSTFYNLPAVGERLSLYTHFSVREDAQQLFGFLTAKEREVFRQLIRITGVGPKLALAVLSGLSVDDLAQAVALQESGRLTKIPGVGKKTAERLLLELKGRLDLAAHPLPAVPQRAFADDVLGALLALGYQEREVAQAVRELPDGTSVEEGIRLALKRLSKF